MFSQKVLSIFDKPKNVGIIKCADGVGEAGNVETGQLVKLYIRVKDEIITEAKFKAYGGILTIACASYLTTLIKDMTVDRAKMITCDDLLKDLEIQDNKLCNDIDLCLDALISALSEYYRKQLS